MSLQPTTHASITRIFDSLDYAALGPIYCQEGGDAFWEERRGACQELGLKLGPPLRDRPPPGGPGLFVGAGVAGPPPVGRENPDPHRHAPPSHPPPHDTPPHTRR